MKIAAPALPAVPATRNWLQRGLDPIRGAVSMVQGAGNLAGEAIGTPIAQAIWGADTWDPSRPAPGGLGRAARRVADTAQYQPIQGHRRVLAGAQDLLGRPAEGYGSHVTNLNARLEHGRGPAYRALITGQNALAYAPAAYAALRPGSALNFNRPGALATGALGRAARLPQAHAVAAAPFNALAASRAGRAVGAAGRWAAGTPLAGAPGVARRVAGVAALPALGEAASGGGLNESSSALFDRSLRELGPSASPMAAEGAALQAHNQLNQQLAAGRLDPALAARYRSRLDELIDARLGPPPAPDPTPTEAQAPGPGPASPGADAPGGGFNPIELFGRLGRAWQGMDPMQQAALALGVPALLYGGSRALSGEMGIPGQAPPARSPAAAPSAGPAPGDLAALDPGKLRRLAELAADPSLTPQAIGRAMGTILPPDDLDRLRQATRAYLGGDYGTIAALYPEATPELVRRLPEGIRGQAINLADRLFGVGDAKARELGLTPELGRKLDEAFRHSGDGFGA